MARQGHERHVSRRETFHRRGVYGDRPRHAHDGRVRTAYQHGGEGRLRQVERDDLRVARCRPDAPQRREGEIRGARTQQIPRQGMGRLEQKQAHLHVLLLREGQVHLGDYRVARREYIQGARPLRARSGRHRDKLRHAHRERQPRSDAGIPGAPRSDARHQGRPGTLCGRHRGRQRLAQQALRETDAPLPHAAWNFLRQVRVPVVLHDARNGRHSTGEGHGTLEGQGT